MKTDYKLIYSDFNDETGVSIVRIQTPYGTFKGKARACPKDQDYASSFMGCHLAEWRAYIRYLKFLKKMTKSNMKVVKHIISHMSLSDRNRTFIEGEYNRLKNDVDQLDLKISQLETEIKTNIKAREGIMKYVKKGKKK